MKKIQGIFKPIPILLMVLAFPLALAAQIGYRYIRGTGTAAAVTCWADTFTVRDCTDAEITAAGGFIDGSGTATYVPIFSDANTLADSDITYAAGTIALGDASTTVIQIKPVNGTGMLLAFQDVPVAGASGAPISDAFALTAMNGSDTVTVHNLAVTNANHTGTGNTLVLLDYDDITGDANSNLNVIRIGALTGTTGAAGEIEAAINIGSGWDAGVYCPSGCTIDGDITIGTNDVDDIVVNGPVRYNVIKEDFGFPLWFHLWSTALGTHTQTDTSVNDMYMLNSQLGQIEYRWEQATSTAPTVSDGYFLPQVDATNNEGIDLTFGDHAIISNVTGGSTFWDEDSGTSAYCEISLKIADISELDIMHFGIKLREAYQDAGNWTGNNTFAFFVLSDALGDLDIVTSLNAGADGNDDTGVTWADGEEKVLRVTVSADSVSFTLDGAAVTQTNAVLNFDDGDTVACEFGYVNDVGDGTPSPGISINYVEIGVSQ